MVSHDIWNMKPRRIPARSEMKKIPPRSIAPRMSGLSQPKIVPPARMGSVKLLTPEMVGDWVIDPPRSEKCRSERNRVRPGAMRLMATPAMM